MQKLRVETQRLIVDEAGCAQELYPAIKEGNGTQVPYELIINNDFELKEEIEKINKEYSSKIMREKFNLTGLATYKYLSGDFDGEMDALLISKIEQELGVLYDSHHEVEDSQSCEEIVELQLQEDGSEIIVLKNVEEDKEDKEDKDASAKKIEENVISYLEQLIKEIKEDEKIREKISKLSHKKDKEIAKFEEKYEKNIKYNPCLKEYEKIGLFKIKDNKIEISEDNQYLFIEIFEQLEAVRDNLPEED